MSISNKILHSSPSSPISSSSDHDEALEAVVATDSKLSDLPTVADHSRSLEEYITSSKPGLPPPSSLVPELGVDVSALDKATPESHPSSTSEPNHEDELGQEPDLTPLRSTRKRTAPTRFIEALDTGTYSPKKVPKPTQRKAQPVRGNWSTQHLLSNPKSKLASCNLSDLLNNERAWTVLTREEQLDLISMIPEISIPELSADLPLPNVVKQYMKSNSSLQADVRLFQEDLAAGRYEPKWLQDAQAAVNKRAKGVFDNWKEKNREQFWGQKQRVDWMALAGESSEHNLQTLVEAGCFMVGDVWLLRRGLRSEGASFAVEKEATITQITSDNLLTFSFPPGQHKLSSPSNGTDIILPGVNGPTPLSVAILKEDGRIVGVRAANTWRDFRCYRKNQDMGSLWDVRELYHRRYAGRPE